jgi:HTH-type transcriptional regulator/antitoxin MqsA
MKSKWHGQPCPLCGEGTLSDSTRQVEERYKGVIFTTFVRGAFCDHCHDGFPEFDPKQETAWVAFRDRVDAEESAELTRAKAAVLAGGGKNAFSRYEKGKTKPVAAVINLFRLLDRHPELLEELRSE